MQFKIIFTVLFIYIKKGYTCLHVAYIYGHSELVSILKTYGAEGYTDYSGKNGLDYSKVSSSTNNDNSTSKFIKILYVELEII